MLYCYRKRGDVKSMTSKIRLTYRLTKEMYDKIVEEAKKRNISVNAEINRIVYEYYNKQEMEQKC